MMTLTPLTPCATRACGALVDPGRGPLCRDCRAGLRPMKAEPLGEAIRLPLLDLRKRVGGDPSPLSRSGPMRAGARGPRHAAAFDLQTRSGRP